MLLAEVWIFIIGNIIAGTAHNLTQLVAGRLLAGVGGAGLMALCTVIVSRTFTFSSIEAYVIRLPNRTHL